MTLEQFQGAHSYTPEIIECPWAFDAALRAEAPVYYDDVNDVYVVSSYDLVREVLTDPERFSSRYMEKLVRTRFPTRSPRSTPRAIPKSTRCSSPTARSTTGTEAWSTRPSHAGGWKNSRRCSTHASRRILDESLPKGRMKFRHDFAHPLPIVMMQEQLRIPGRGPAQGHGVVRDHLQQQRRQGKIARATQARGARND